MNTLVINASPPEWVCLYCAQEVPDGKVCYPCHEYKSVMTVKDWESYTGQTWEE